MSYILRRTDGTTLTTIADGSSDTTTTSLAFPGKNYSPYSEPIADNLVKLLENFSGNSAPNHPLSGQLWYDRSISSVKVFATGNVWRTIGTTVSSTEPTTQGAGEFWFNDVTQQLYVKNSSAVYVLVGPITPAGFAETDVKAETITDNVGPTSHQILSLYAAGRRTFILNSDAPFTTSNVGVNLGFANVYTGLTANTAVSLNKFGGTSIDSERLGSYLASEYLRSDIDQVMTGNINLRSNTKAYTLGTIDHLVFKDDPATSVGILENTKNAGWIIRGRVGSNPTDLITINSVTGAVSFAGNVSSTNIDANTAQRLAIPRNITISGFVNGVASFDGSQNITITTANVYLPVNRAGDTMTGTLTLPTNSLTVGTTQLAAYNGMIGVGTDTPATTLDVNGSFRVRMPTVIATGGAAAINCLTSGSTDVQLMQASTIITISNLTLPGQTARIILRPDTGVTPTSVTFAGTSISWPNGFSPNLFVGPNKVAIVTLLVVGALVLATYVTY